MENTEGKSPIASEKPVSRRTFLKGAFVGALGLLGIQKAAEQASKINPEEVIKNLNTEIGGKLDANDIRDQLLPNRQPPKEVKDASVAKYNEIMHPPTPVPTLEKPKR